MSTKRSRILNYWTDSFSPVKVLPTDPTDIGTLGRAAYIEMRTRKLAMAAQVEVNGVKSELYKVLVVNTTQTMIWSKRYLPATTVTEGAEGTLDYETSGDGQYKMEQTYKEMPAQVNEGAQRD